MKAIVAADREWNIGIDGKLLAHIPRDLQYFKEKTIGKTVVMGKLTFESLPGQRPLPGRTNIIMTHSPETFLAKYDRQIKNLQNGRVFAVKDLNELFAYISFGKDEFNNPACHPDTFVIGGGQVYKQMLPYCDEVFVTRLNKTFIGDTKFPDLDSDEQWRLAWQSEHQFENDISYEWTIYKRKMTL